MTNRAKRLRKGIESLDKQIRIHKEKMRLEVEKGNIERAEYYRKEIDSKEEAKRRKEDILKKE